jgi:hypothetical protein
MHWEKLNSLLSRGYFGPRASGGMTRRAHLGQGPASAGSRSARAAHRRRRTWHRRRGLRHGQEGSGRGHFRPENPQFGRQPPKHVGRRSVGSRRKTELCGGSEFLSFSQPDIVIGATPEGFFGWKDMTTVQSVILSSRNSNF